MHGYGRGICKIKNERSDISLPQEIVGQSTHRMLQLIHELCKLDLVVAHQDGIGDHYQRDAEQQRLENGPCSSMADN